MQRVVQPGCFIHAVLLLGPPLKKVRRSLLLLSGRLLPGPTEARALSITLTRASSLGSLSENFKHPHYWFLSPPPPSPPGHRHTSSTHRAWAREGAGRLVVEVEIEVKKTKRMDRKRDSEIKAEASPLRNNVGDLTLLHCSASCYLQLWADVHGDCGVHGMAITHSNDALRHMNESNREITCTAPHSLPSDCRQSLWKESKILGPQM